MGASVSSSDQMMLALRCVSVMLSTAFSLASTGPKRDQASADFLIPALISRISLGDRA